MVTAGFAGFDPPQMNVEMRATIKTSVCYRIAMLGEQYETCRSICKFENGKKHQVVRGRMPKALVAQAKKRTGVVSDTDLIELALANIAVADDYADWLLARRGTIDGEANLEF